MRNKKLFEINIITDDDTGMYTIGEIDFGMCTADMEEAIGHGKEKEIRKIFELVMTIAKGEYRPRADNGINNAKQG